MSVCSTLKFQVSFVAKLAPSDGDARIQRQRTAFILSKVVQGVRDEDGDVSIVSSAAHTSKLLVPVLSSLTTTATCECWIKIQD